MSRAWLDILRPRRAVRDGHWSILKIVTIRSQLLNTSPVYVAQIVMWRRVDLPAFLANELCAKRHITLRLITTLGFVIAR